MRYSTENRNILRAGTRKSDFGSLLIFIQLRSAYPGIIKKKIIAIITLMNNKLEFEEIYRIVKGEIIDSNIQTVILIFRLSTMN